MSEEGKGIEIEVRDGADRTGPDRGRRPLYRGRVDPDSVKRDGTGSAYLIDGGRATVGGLVTDEAPV